MLNMRFNINSDSLTLREAGIDRQ